MTENFLGTVAAEDFTGRSVEIEKLLRHAERENEKRGLLILSAPAVGATELCKQTYDKLFNEQSETIPIYFSVKSIDRTAKSSAVRFLRNFLTQFVAFRQRNPQILNASPDVYELVERAAPEDKNWIETLVKTCEREGKFNDEITLVRNCLSAPLRAGATGAKTFLMIDNLDEAGGFAGEIDFVEEIKEMLAHLTTPFALAGKRRFLLDAVGANSILNGAETLRINALGFAEAGKLIENLAAKSHVAFNEQTRDLIAGQTNGKPLFIKFLIEAASRKKSDLSNFQLVEKIYADEIFGGALKRFYDAVLQKIAPDFETEKTLVELLENLSRSGEKQPIETWQSRLNLSGDDFHKLIARLNVHEITRLSSNFIEPMSENEILSDYVAARFRLEIKGENRALVVGEMLSQFIKRAPRLMAKFYRRSSAINLRALLAAFDCREMPAGFLDYKIFRERFKGADAAEIFARIEADAERINLPQIVYTAETAAVYPPIKQVAEAERSAIAFGFETREYTEADETIWIAAEIDSKLEADRELAEFWCDRLEMVALNCNFPKYKIWLIAPEGFAPEASEILNERNAFGSSRAQFDLLAKFLGAENLTEEKAQANEYEIIVPMGEDTELIAAHTIEDIARRYAFDPKAINQIKTALVEACINATEHSLSPDRKIYQKFTIEPDRITIKISNRGLRIADKTTAEIVPDEGRRGWGLKLMRTLMDEVKFEQVDDGTRISMTKYLKKS